MMYFVFLFGFCFVFWMVDVSCNPSPYIGVLSLVLGAAFGCGLLVSMGGSFVSLVLFLIYLGDMLVIFAYSSALVEEPYPVAWANWGGVVYAVGYVLVIVGFAVMGFWLWSVEGFGNVTVDVDGLCIVRLDFGGVSWFYYFGNVMFLIAGWGLLFTLFVVLELVRDLSRGVLRAI